MEISNIQNMSIRDIATLIRHEWKNEYFGSTPYIDAMLEMDSINDKYYLDSGSSIVAYFLSNATTWKGEIAREVKKELNRRLKEIK